MSSVKEKVNKSLNVPFIKLIIYMVSLIFIAGISWAVIRTDVSVNTNHGKNKDRHMTIEKSTRIAVMEKEFEISKETTLEIRKIANENKFNIGIIKTNISYIVISQRELKDDMKDGFEEIKELIRNGGN